MMFKFVQGWFAVVVLTFSLMTNAAEYTNNAALNPAYQTAAGYSTSTWTSVGELFIDLYFEGDNLFFYAQVEGDPIDVNIEIKPAQYQRGAGYVVIDFGQLGLWGYTIHAETFEILTLLPSFVDRCDLVEAANVVIALREYASPKNILSVPNIEPSELLALAVLFQLTPTLSEQCWYWQEPARLRGTVDAYVCGEILDSHEAACDWAFCDSYTHCDAELWNTCYANANRDYSACLGGWEFSNAHLPGYWDTSQEIGYQPNYTGDSEPGCCVQKKGDKESIFTEGLSDPGRCTNVGGRVTTQEGCEAEKGEGTVIVIGGTGTRTLELAN